MRKLAIIIALVAVCSTAAAQITVKRLPVDIAKAMSGRETLTRYVSEANDTTYSLVLYTYNQFAGYMTVTLGDRSQATAILRSMYDYTPASKDEVIGLNNPGNNRAYYKSDLGYKQYVIFGDDDAGSRLGGYLGIKSIKKFLAALAEE